MDDGDRPARKDRVKELEDGDIVAVLQEAPPVFDALTASPPAAGYEGHHAGRDHFHGKPSYSEVFRNRAFLSLWFAQIFSQFAQNLTWITLGAYVASQTHATTLVSVIIVSALLAQFLLSPFAGVVVDRVPKRTVLLASNALRVVLTLMFVLTIPLPVASQTAAIVVLIFIANSVAQFFAPAEAVTIPLIVEKRNLIVATSLFNLTFNACQSLPLVLGLVFLEVLGIVPVLLFVALCYVVAALLVATLPARTRVARIGPAASSMGESWSHIKADVREALHFLARDPGLRLIIFQINIAPTFLFLLGTLGLNFVADTFGLKEAEAWRLLLPAGLGLVLGAVTVGRVTLHRRKEDIVNFGLLLMGVAITILGAIALVVHFVGRVFGRVGDIITRHVHVLPVAHDLGLLPPAMVVATFIGVGMAWSTIPAQTLVFERTEEKVRGRVWSMQQLIGGAVPIVPLLVVGPLADWLGTATIMTLLGLIILAVSIFSIRVDGRLQRRRRRRANLR